MVSSGAAKKKRISTPNADAVASVLRRKVKHYAERHVPTIMAARVEDCVLVSSPYPDVTTIMKYFLLQGAVGDAATARLQHVAAKAVAAGVGGEFFRYAADFLADKGYGGRKPTRKFVSM